MLKFTELELRNSDMYRNAIMNSYRIYLDSNYSYLRFRVSKRMRKTEMSGKIYTLKQFEEQLIIFIQQLNQ